jgi:hypothetical protein
LTAELADGADFVGSCLSGVVGAHYASQGADGTVTHNWQMIWAIPAVLSVVLTMLFVVSFKDRESGGKALANGK